MKIEYKVEMEPVSFIAGDYQEFQYNITDSETGLDVSLVAAQTKMVLYPYGDNENPSLVVDGEIVGKNNSAFRIQLTSDATKDLRGLYIQQPIIIDNNGKVFRPGQGAVNILPRAFDENFK